MLSTSVRLKKIGAPLLAAGLAMGSLIFPSNLPSANAVTGSPENPYHPDAYNLVDPNHHVFLLIRKRLNPSDFKQPYTDLFEGSSVTGQPLAGVTFKVQRLDYDLTTIAGQAAVAAATPEEAAKHIASDGQPTTAEKTTDNNGYAYWDTTNDQLKVGAYLVTEVSNANANVNGKAVTNLVSSAPFIVTLPHQGEDALVWQHDHPGQGQEYHQTIINDVFRKIPRKYQLDFGINQPILAGNGNAELPGVYGDDITARPQTVWHYATIVYPKNSTVSVTKTHDDFQGMTASQGDTIDYAVTVGLPRLEAHQYLRYLDVYDRIPSQLAVGPDKIANGLHPSLDFPYNDRALNQDKDVIFKNNNKTVSLDPGVDYVVENPKKVTEASFKPAEAHDELKLVFTAAGLQKISEAAKTGDPGSLIVHYTFHVVGPANAASQPYKIINDAGTHIKINMDPHLDPHTPPTIPTAPPENVIPDMPTPTPEVPTLPENPSTPVAPPVTDYFVPVRLKKVDFNTPTKALPHARFYLYQCFPETVPDALVKKYGEEQVFVNGDDRTTPKKIGNYWMVGTPIGGTRGFTTGEDGTVTVPGVRYRSDDIRGEKGGYCFVEVDAPDGYALAPQPIFFRLTSAEKEATTPVEVTAKDAPSAIPLLPAAGGAGVGALLAGGAAVVGVGIYLGRRNRKSAAA